MTCSHPPPLDGTTRSRGYARGRPEDHWSAKGRSRRNQRSSRAPQRPQQQRPQRPQPRRHYQRPTDAWLAHPLPPRRFQQGTRRPTFLRSSGSRKRPTAAFTRLLRPSERSHPGRIMLIRRGSWQGCHSLPTAMWPSMQTQTSDAFIREAATRGMPASGKSPLVHPAAPCFARPSLVCDLTGASNSRRSRRHFLAWEHRHHQLQRKTLRSIDQWKICWVRYFTIFGASPDSSHPPLATSFPLVCLSVIDTARLTAPVASSAQRSLLPVAPQVAPQPIQAMPIATSKTKLRTFRFPTTIHGP